MGGWVVEGQLLRLTAQGWAVGPASMQPVGALAEPPGDGQQPVAHKHARGQARWRAQAEAQRTAGSVKAARNRAAQPAPWRPLNCGPLPVAPRCQGRGRCVQALQWPMSYLIVAVPLGFAAAAVFLLVRMWAQRQARRLA